MPLLLFTSILSLRIKARQFPCHAIAVEHTRIACEFDWIRGGSPYFKVYPTMIPLLSGVGIEVPVDYRRLPFQAFAVHFPGLPTSDFVSPPANRTSRTTTRGAEGHRLGDN